MSQAEKAKDNEKQIKAMTFGLKVIEELVNKFTIDRLLHSNDGNDQIG